jgi:hypothetical protein
MQLKNRLNQLQSVAVSDHSFQSEDMGYVEHLLKLTFGIENNQFAPLDTN